MTGAAQAASATSPLRARDLLAALVVVILWGVNFVAMKWGLRSFSPFQLGAARYLCAALPLVLLVRPPRMHWRWVLLFGLFQGVGQFGFLFIGLKVGMTAGLASVLLQTQVFFTALLGFALLRERPGLPLRVGMGLAALGLVCFAMNYVGPGSGMGVAAATTLAGLLLTLCGAAMWASSNIVARLAQQHSPGFDPLAFVIWSSLVPVLPFMALSALFDPDAARWLQWQTLASVPLLSWAAVAYLGWAEEHGLPAAFFMQPAAALPRQPRGAVQPGGAGGGPHRRLAAAGRGRGALAVGGHCAGGGRAGLCGAGAQTTSQNGR